MIHDWYIALCTHHPQSNHLCRHVFGPLYQSSIKNTCSQGPSMLLQMAVLCLFLWLSSRCSIVYMYRIFFIQSSPEEHFGCLHVWVTMSNAAVNIGVHISLRINVFKFFSISLEEVLLAQMVTLFLIF